MDLCQQFFQASGRVRPHLEQVRAFARDRVAFEYFVRCRGMIHECMEMLRGVDGDGDKRRDVLSEEFVIDLGKIPLDIAILFEFSQTLTRGRQRQPHSFGDLISSCAAVFLQNLENCHIYLVKVHSGLIFLGEFHK